MMDAIPKDDMGSMEHPIFSLSTKPDKNIRRYEHNGVKVTVTPSVRGLATVHDKDILIYCISQLVAKMNAGHALLMCVEVVVPRVECERAIDFEQGLRVLIALLDETEIDRADASFWRPRRGAEGWVEHQVLAAVSSPL
jgi:hypothetical protein